MYDSPTPRVFNCRHCNAKNRLNPINAANKITKIRCGGCSEPFFLTQEEGLPYLDTKAFEHPHDANALAMLRQVPGAATILKFVMAELSERRMRMLYQQSAVKVGKNHLAPLHEQMVSACKILDLNKIPDLFVINEPSPNAYAIGVEDPFIVLNTAMLDVLDTQQIQGVMAHELGHILAGHQLYRTTLHLLLQLAGRMVGNALPFGEVAMAAVYQALMHWNRCSELTADRAQMLVQRDFDSYVRCEMNFAAGCNHTSTLLSTEAFLEQAREAAAMQEENLLNRVYASMQIGNASHPFPVWRVGHMYEWVTTGNYLEILSDSYAMRHADLETPVLDDFAEPEEKGGFDKVLDQLKGILY